MITVITGEIRAGKTTFAMAQIFDPSVEDDRDIYCDLPLVHDALVERYGEDVVSSQITQIPRIDPETNKLWFADISRLRKLMEKRDKKGRGPVIIIDEAHAVFPSGIKKIFDRNTGLVVEDCYYEQFHTLLTLAGHYTCHLVFITQRPGALFYPICELSKESFFVENTIGLGFPTSFRAKVFGQLPSRSLEKLSAFDISKCNTIGYPKPVKYDETIQRLFKSQTKTSTGGSASPQALESRRISKSIWKNPKLIFFGLLLVGATAWMFLSWGSGDSEPKGKPVNGPIVMKSPVQDVKDPEGAKVFETVSDASLAPVSQPQEWAADNMSMILNGNVFNNGGGLLDWSVHAVDSNGDIWMGERPLSVVASFYKYELAQNGCSILLSRGETVYHRLLVPGCLYSVTKESENVGANQKESQDPSRATSSVQRTESSDQARSVETADRLSREASPSVWDTR